MAGNEDRRVRRSREALGDALISLMQEKAFDGITVQDVLDRAGVGRSTFYAHYKDKDDLFLSDAEEFLEMMSNRLSRKGDVSDRVLPVEELFAHVAEMRKLVEALVDSGRIHDFFELAQGCFARGIERRLEDLPRSQHLAAETRAAMGQALAGALLSLLRSWLKQGAAKPAREMDALFHQLVWSGVQKL
ncbi:MAG TPA: TetR/AcrR family transcriptional regulator [Myxococcales bacterium]|nr:TetR/AcrR family transcriptional regulator [Myxococcales bacterium]